MCYICPMRFALSPEQKKFFVRFGYIAFEELPQKEKELGQIVYELTDRKPLRIAHRKELESWPAVPSPFEYETDCGVLISKKYGWGVFFTFALPDISKIFEDFDGAFDFLLFTKRYLDQEKHPVVYK